MSALRRSRVGAMAVSSFDDSRSTMERHGVLVSPLFVRCACHQWNDTREQIVSVELSAPPSSRPAWETAGYWTGASLATSSRGEVQKHHRGERLVFIRLISLYSSGSNRLTRIVRHFCCSRCGTPGRMYTLRHRGSAKGDTRPLLKLWSISSHSPADTANYYNH